MIDEALVRRARRWFIVAGVALGGLLAVVAVAAFLLSMGTAPKPLAYRRTAPGIRLAPGSRQTFEFESFCLDNRRGSPQSADAYALMDTAAIDLRPYLREILDEYLSHPARWNRSDVQQAVWYTEGHKPWQTLSPEQRRLIETATGKRDPAGGNPVIILTRMSGAFGTIVRTNVTLALLLLLVVLLAVPAPLPLLERSLSWILGGRLSASLRDGPAGRWVEGFSRSAPLQRLRAAVDVQVSRLVFRHFGRRN